MSQTLLFKPTQLTCPVCHVTFTPKTDTHIYCSEYCSEKAMRNRKKEWLDQYKTECSVCGYKRCKDALAFHHKDPSDKIFDISKNVGLDKDTLLAEIKKCQVLCMNCHTELHEELRLEEEYLNSI